VTWDGKIQQAITEMQACIQAMYPDAIFHSSQGEDPAGIYIDAYTDAEDSFCVLDLVHDWLVDLHVNEGLSMHGIPLPRERAAMTQAQPLLHSFRASSSCKRSTT
jgi:hypothetical protein